MSTLDRYVCMKLLRTFVPTTVGLCFVFFVGASFRLLREEDLSLAQIAMTLPWVIPFLLPYLIPMAFMSTVSLVYGRLTADNEVLAFGSLGIRARTLCAPALGLALILTVACSWLSAEVVPYCHQKKREAARAVFQQLFNLGEGAHWSRAFPKQGFDLYVREYVPGELRGIVIHYTLQSDDLTKSGRRLAVQLVARSGRIAPESGRDRLVLVLEDLSVTLMLAGQPDALPTGDVALDSKASAGTQSDATTSEDTKSGSASEAKSGTPPAIKEQVGPSERAQLAKDEPVRLHLDRYVQAIGLGGWRRIKEVDYGSASLLRLKHEAEARAALAAGVGGLTSTLTALDKRAVEADVELAMRANLALASLAITLIVLPLTLLLRARNPLVPFCVGMLATAGLYFAPLLLGRSLAETAGSGALVYLGSVVPLVAGAVIAWFASRG